MAEETKTEEHTVTTTTHSEKVMGGSRYSPKDTRSFITSFILIFLLLAGVTVLIVWLVYRPHDPDFTVVGAAIYDLNMTSPTMISATMQFTVVARNSNKRTSIYYDHLSTFVSYRNQQITPAVMLPPMFHESKSTVALSPIIGGGFVPISMEVSNGLVMDQAYGIVAMRLVLMGRAKYKAGAIRTKHYGVYIKCDVMLGLKKGVVGQVPLLGAPDCDVDM